jgi:hypothetical protein
VKRWSVAARLGSASLIISGVPQCSIACLDSIRMRLPQSAGEMVPLEKFLASWVLITFKIIYGPE